MLLVPGIQIVDRYIGRQIFSATLIGVLVLSFVVVLGNLMKDVFELLVDKGLPITDVLQFILFILPFSLIFTIPWGLLTAVLLVFGRLSADNELVSLRMAGLSLWRICRPVFAIALALATFSLWINTSIAPKSQAKMKGVMFEMVTDDPMALFEPNTPITDIPDYEIFAKEREGNLLTDLTIIQLGETGFPVLTIHAQSALVVYNEKEVKLELELNGATAITRDKDEPEEGEVGGGPRDIQLIESGGTAAVFHTDIDLTELLEKSKRHSPSTMPSGELAERIKTDESLTQNKRNAMRTEIHKRISFSMACLTFVFIGIPLGVTAQRRETSIGFLLSLVIAIVYFLFIIIADTFRDDAYAYLLMWLPNVIFIGLGLFLFFRLSRK